MVEERNENLQDAEGKNEQSEAPINSEKQPNEIEVEEKTEIEQTEQVTLEKGQPTEEKSADEVVVEIEKHMANESESSSEEHHAENEEKNIPLLSYKDLDFSALIEEAKKLIAENPVQKIRKHLEEIKDVIDDKVYQLIEAKKAENPDEEVHLDIPEAAEFKYVWKDFRKKLSNHRKEVQEKLEQNLNHKLNLIEQLKDVVDAIDLNFEERMKKFKEIQREWRISGNVPRSRYSDIWRTFKHHEERFYDLLDLDRDYRDKIFQENLDKKKAIIDRANELLKENDIHKIFKELQILHKDWKEETGPVAREQREEVWNEFKEVTKKIHDKRREFYKTIKEEFGSNLEKKEELIAQLQKIAENIPQNHKEWQEKIKEVENIRETFYHIGYVSKKHRDEIWNSFKTSLRTFNKEKNKFYKSLKELQKENLDKKMKLIETAESLKDSEDWETATPKFKEIQEEWKKIGHVPRKYSEKIWKEFRTACNHYFDRFHQHGRDESNAELNNYIKKKDYLKALKEKTADESESYTIDDIKKFTEEWKTLGYVPHNKNYVNVKFNKFINSLYSKLNIDQRELSFLRFKDMVDDYFEQGNHRKLDYEKIFVRQKIDAIQKEIQQLENNMMFIKSDDDNNPFTKEGDKQLKKNTEILEFWKKKYAYLNSLNY